MVRRRSNAPAFGLRPSAGEARLLREMTRGYTASEVAKVLGLSVGQVRAYVRAGFLAPERGPRGEMRFSFQDLVLLRSAKGLVGARIPARKVRRALRKLREQLPEGRGLAGVTIAADGERVVVKDGRATWNPESGQVLFDFEVSELSKKVAPFARRAAAAVRADEEQAGALDAEGWYDWGCELEASAPEQARDAYRRALELAPEHADAHVNLGRLLHEGADPAAAEGHYRLALKTRPDDATAAFNLGVAMEDLARPADAIDAYLIAIAADPDAADAHYNLARLYEQIGEPRAALRHLRTYRKLTRG